MKTFAREYFPEKMVARLGPQIEFVPKHRSNRMPGLFLRGSSGFRSGSLITEDREGKKNQSR